MDDRCTSCILKVLRAFKQSWRGWNRIIMVPTFFLPKSYLTPDFFLNVEKLWKYDILCYMKKDYILLQI